jgi:hypothetical protein
MGGNISRDPSNHHSTRHNSSGHITTRKLKSSYRNNSLPTIASEEKKLTLLKKPDKRIIHGRTYHAVESSSYMLPRDDKEIDRLHEEHFVTKELLGL